MRLFRKLLWLVPLALALANYAPAQPEPAADAGEHHISKAEAKELFRSVDDILQFASEETGLPILHPVKKRLATREEVARYVEDRLKEAESGERLDRSALPLKKLGLLPRDFKLSEYMLGLYKEQVEGWYDTHTKTVYLLDWVEPDDQKPVMAHELVHALQDQNFGLEKWLNVRKDSKDDSVQIALDEERVARESVVEGQAMIVLYDYQLRSSGQSVESAPGYVASMTASMLDGSSTPMYAEAPLYLRESMLFPYSYGTEFIRTILVQRGKQAAFSGVFQRPPSDSREIMQPAAYMAGEAQPDIRVVPLDRVLGPEWQRVDVSGIGEIDLKVLLRQWGGKDVADRLAPAWRGGYYEALSQKHAPKDAPLRLALVLNFASHDAAKQFAAVYVTGLSKRYKSVLSTPNPHQWMTEEGLVSLDVDGDAILALESFTPSDTAKLQAALSPSVAAMAAQ